MTGPMQAAQASQTWKARMAELPAATHWLENMCRHNGIEPATCLRLTLLLEELFTNTVLHGHGGDCDAPVHLTMQAAPEVVVLTYADTAPPFDPLSWADARTAALDAELAGRPVGQLGLHLIRQMAGKAHYALDSGWNRLRLELPRRPIEGLPGPDGPTA